MLLGCRPMSLLSRSADGCRSAQGSQNAIVEKSTGNEQRPGSALSRAALGCQRCAALSSELIQTAWDVLIPEASALHRPWTGLR